MHKKRIFFKEKHTNEGLIKVINYLDEKLCDKWEIYVQPFLNGLLPDILILHPEKGIHIFCQGDESKEKTRIEFIDREIRNIYCPRIGNDEKPFPWVISKTIIADIETNTEPTKFLKIFTIEQLLKEKVEEVVPFVKEKPGNDFNSDLADDLRGWLRPSDFRLDQMSEIERLDRKQQEIVDKKTPNGIRGVRGSAGSGKTLVLAHKAAKALREGKKVLFVTFNITLINYIRALTLRCLQDLSDRDRQICMDNIIFDWYHSWAESFIMSTTTPKQFEEYKNFKKSILKGQKDKKDTSWIHIELPKYLDQHIKENVTIEDKYDLVLVDEAQDYKQTWWQNLKDCRKPKKNGGEIYIVGDISQDIYFRKELDDDNLKKFGLKGWVTLKESYRLPKSYIPKITNFHETFLKSEHLNRPENTSMANEVGEFDMFEECITSWTNVDSTEQNNQLCAEIILNSAPLCKEFSYSNLVILADRRADAMKMRKILHKNNIKFTDTFSAHPKPREREELERKKKISFLITNDKVKITTVYSFKGIESPFLLIQITEGQNAKKIYTALTRLRMGLNSKCHIFVVNSVDKFKEYGNSWN